MTNKRIVHGSVSCSAGLLMLGACGGNVSTPFVGLWNCVDPAKIQFQYNITGEANGTLTIGLSPGETEGSGPTCMSNDLPWTISTSGTVATNLSTSVCPNMTFHSMSLTLTGNTMIYSEDYTVGERSFTYQAVCTKN